MNNSNLGITGIQCMADSQERTDNHGMTGSHGDAGSQCQHWLELLPWYVNDSLAATERDNIGEHLASCPRCSGEHAFLLALQQQVRSNDTLSVPRPAWSRIQSQLQARSQRPLFEWVSVLRRFALPLAACGIIIVIANLLPWLRNDNTDYRLMSSPTAAPSSDGVAELRVLLVAGTGHDAAEALFLQAGVSIIAGPTVRGVYTVAPRHPVDDRDKFIADLRRNALVDFVEWVE